MYSVPGNEDRRTGGERDRPEVPVAGNILQGHSRQPAVHQPLQLLLLGWTQRLAGKRQIVIGPRLPQHLADQIAGSGTPAAANRVPSCATVSPMLLFFLLCSLAFSSPSSPPLPMFAGPPVHNLTDKLRHRRPTARRLRCSIWTG